MAADEDRIVPSLKRIDHSKSLAGKHSLSFKLGDNNNTVSIDLTQRELLDTWLAIAAYLNGLGNHE